VRLAHRHGLDAAGAVDEHAHAAVQRMADRRHLAGQLVGQDRLGRYASPVEPLEPVLFLGAQPQQVAVQGRNVRHLLGGPRPPPDA